MAFIVFSCPIVMLVVLAQLYYFYLLRKKILRVTRDCSRLLTVLNAPIVSLIQDSINGQVNMRTLGVTGYYLKELMKLNDV